MVGFQDAGALGEGLYVFDLGYGGKAGVKILLQGYRLGGSVASLLGGGELDVAGEGGDVATDLALEAYPGRYGDEHHDHAQGDGCDGNFQHGRGNTALVSIFFVYSP